MPQHPPYYAELVRRRVAADPPLSLTERRELELHLRICPRCAYDLADRLRPGDPEAARTRLVELEGRLTAEQVTPYLRELAQAIRVGGSLTAFQRFLWSFLLRDREAMGRYRLFEAEVWFRPRV